MRIAKEVALYNQGGIQNGIDGAEDRASKVATSFITRVSESEGIKVHNADDTTDYIQINSNGIDLVNDNVSIANFGESARVGKEASSRFLINADSLEAYDDTNAKYFEVSPNGMTYGTHTVADTSYADGKASAAQSAAISAAASDATSKANAAQSAAEATASADATSKANAAQSAAEATASADATAKANAAQSAAEKVATNFITTDSTGIKVHNTNDSTNYTHIGSSGMDVRVGGDSVAEFGSSARIGKQSDFNLGITSGGFSFKEASTERVGISAEADSSSVLASMFSSGNASTDALVYSNDLSGTDHNASILLGAGGATGTPYISAAPIADVNLSRSSTSATAFLEANYDNTNRAYVRADASSSSQDITINGDTNVVGDLTVYGEPVIIRKVYKSSVSSLPTTISNSSITANMECIHSVLSNPSAQTGDWTVTTSAGSLTISGSISGTTDIKLYLAVPSV